MVLPVGLPMLARSAARAEREISLHSLKSAYSRPGPEPMACGRRGRFAPRPEVERAGDRGRSSRPDRQDWFTALRRGRLSRDLDVGGFRVLRTDGLCHCLAGRRARLPPARGAVDSYAGLVREVSDHPRLEDGRLAEGDRDRLEGADGDRLGRKSATGRRRPCSSRTRRSSAGRHRAPTSPTRS